MNTTIIEGLSKEELEAYTHLLGCGQATVLELAKSSNINRTTLYRILDMLVNKGLVSKIFIKRKHYYIAERPQKLIQFVEQQEDKLKDMLPNLLVLEDQGTERPKVKFYEGRQAIHNLFMSLLDERKEIVAFISPDIFYETFDFGPDFVKKRVRLGIGLRYICENTKVARKRRQLGEVELREMKLVKKMPMDAAYFIVGNKVVMFSMKSWYIGVLIENRQIAEGLKAVFESFWTAI